MSTTCPERCDVCRDTRHAGGFAIVSAIFILVVLAALAGYVVSASSTQNLNLAQDVQSARAYQAARAGLEWGISRWLAATPDCAAAPPAFTFPAADMAPFTVTVTRNLITSGGVNFCQITSTATTAAAVGSVGYAERRLSVLVEGI